MVICQALMFEDDPAGAEFAWDRLDPALTDHRDVLAALLRHDIGWGILQPLYRRAFLERLGPLPESIRASQDRELHIRALGHAPQIAISAEALAYVRTHHQPSLGKTWDTPRQLRSRLMARRLAWRAIRRAGLATPDNRRSLAREFLRHARMLARARQPVSALLALAYGLRLLPGIAPRLQLLAFGVPALAFNAVTGRGGHFAKRIFHRFQFERTEDHYMQRRYQPAADPHPGERPA
jgi:hypothetical protein